MATSSTDTIAQSAIPIPVPRTEWTVAQLLDQFGGVPPERVHLAPVPGTATEEDLLEMGAQTGRICELIDGTLVEKTMGYFEAWLAGEILFLIRSYLAQHDLGIVTGPDGCLRLLPRQVRGPDVAFVRRERLPDGRVPREPIPSLVPSLAVEVLSKSNTRREMERKLREYFEAGVNLVWYIEPRTQTATAYTSPDQFTEIGVDGELDGGEILPGFRLALKKLFDGPANS